MKMTFRTIVFGGVIVFLAVAAVVVFVPSLVWKPQQTTVAQAYAPDQERGRTLFYSNGCNYCHTQYVRADDTAMGPVSQGGDYVFDNPMILGSERTGPDLSYVGRKRSQAWEIEHLKDPRRLSPNSLMPRFAFLPEDDLMAISSYLFSLGNRVAQERMITPPQAYAGLTSPLLYPQMAPATGDQPQGWATWEAAGLQEGKETYVRYCMTCHGCAGNGLGSYGGTLSVTPADYKQEPIRNMPDDQWIWHVSEGVPGTVMPTWKASLTEDQRWKVIRYIQQIFSRPVERDPDEGDPSGAYADLTNPVPLTAAVVDQGKRIFTRECLVCHGAAATGQGPYHLGLLPQPPDFSDSGHYGTLQDQKFTDSDYFWRISEGLPWSAMPAWKIQYSEEDRWALVHYVRTNLTQTEPRPVINFIRVRPVIYLSQTMPESASFERGRKIYLTTCADCHGLSGQGDGWNGQYLNAKPADLTDPGLRDRTVGELFATVSLGVLNTSDPVWEEWLPEEQRWDVIEYMTQAFVVGQPFTSGAYGDGATAANFLTLSKQNWLDEGHTISETHGADLYATYCVGCHGDTGQGGVEGLASHPSGSPASFPADLPEAYILWRAWEGVPDSMMYPFQWLLSDADIWDITAYVESFNSTQGGGQP